jgi:hypothetical protein
MSAHEVSIFIVYPCGQTVHGSHHSREVLLTFAGSPVPLGKVRGQQVMLDLNYRKMFNPSERPHFFKMY